METKDPALTKTRITDTDANTLHNHDSIDDTAEQKKSTQTLQETVIGTKYVSDDVDHGDHSHEDIHHNYNNVMSTDNDIEDYTTVNKGTDTFKEGVIHSEHVNDDDNAARQPDRRDQEGATPFDKGINEDTIGSEEPKSDEITDMNRYASIDNAQVRVLDTDEEE